MSLSRTVAEILSVINLDNHIPIINTLETNFGDFFGGGRRVGYGIMPFFSYLSLAAAERHSVNY